MTWTRPTFLIIPLFFLAACAQEDPVDETISDPGVMDSETPIAATQPDTLRLKEIYQDIDTEYDQMMAQYQTVSGQLSPEARQLYEYMQQMHGQVDQYHEQMMTGGFQGRGMMGRGMMGRGMHDGMGMMSMHGLREWDQQMMSMHEQMTQYLRNQGYEDMAAMHAQMMQYYGQALDAAGEDTEAPIEAPETPEGAAVAGQTVFAQQCATCHGQQGQGMAGVFPPLAGSAWVTGSEEDLIRIVLQGLHGPLEVQNQTYNGTMPAFGARLSNEELAAVLSYVRSSFGNNADDISPSQVASVRQEYPATGTLSPDDLR